VSVDGPSGTHWQRTVPLTTAGARWDLQRYPFTAAISSAVRGARSSLDTLQADAENPYPTPDARHTIENRLSIGGPARRNGSETAAIRPGVTKMALEGSTGCCGGTILHPKRDSLLWRPLTVQLPRKSQPSRPIRASDSMIHELDALRAPPGAAGTMATYICLGTSLYSSRSLPRAIVSSKPVNLRSRSCPTEALLICS
jgi:hypothetical protein